MQCVSTELFPTFSVKISKCLQQKAIANSAFKMNDVGDEAVEDVIFRLKQMRSMNNKEISYLRKLIQRALTATRTETS